MAKKIIRIGLDFDGVVAYNPARLARAPIKWAKKKILGKRKLSFFVPKNQWQRFMWTVVHESSIFPAKGCELLNDLSKRPDIELYLITARYGFLKGNLMKWLERHNLRSTFKKISVNEKCEQPHEYKLRMVQEFKLDYFVEDNLDIVEYVYPKTTAKVLWIYNFFDRNHPYKNKFPYLRKALQAIFLS